MQEPDVVGQGDSLTEPPVHPTQRSRQVGQPLIAVMALAAGATAVFTGIAAYSSYQNWQQNREVSCILYATDRDGKPADYADLDPLSQRAVDALGCEVSR